MDKETREALEMSREELHRRAVQGRPVPVAKEPPTNYRITSTNIPATITSGTTGGAARATLHPAPALSRLLAAATR